MKSEIQEFDHVLIKASGVKGDVVDIHFNSNVNRNIYIVEDDKRGKDGGFPLYDCYEDELEKTTPDPMDNTIRAGNFVRIKKSGIEGMVCDIYHKGDIPHYIVQDDRMPEDDEDSFYDCLWSELEKLRE